MAAPPGAAERAPGTGPARPLSTGPGAAGPVRYILVSGSRTWPKRWARVIEDDLDYQRSRLDASATLVVIHGGAYKGADKMARDWVAERRAAPAPGLAAVGELVIEADWDAPCRPGPCAPGHRRPRRTGGTYCPAAGNYRNEDMVVRAAGLGVFVALVYCLNDSHGATDCFDRLRTHRVNTRPLFVYT